MLSEHGTVIFQETRHFYGNQGDWYSIHKRPTLRTSHKEVRFEVLREINIRISVLWDWMQCSLVELPA